MSVVFVVGGVVALIVILVSLGIRQIPQAQAAIVQRLGRYHKTLHPGLNLIIPFLDHIEKVAHVNSPDSTLPPHRMDMREQVLDVPKQDVITKDNVLMEVDTVLFYQITEPYKAFYEISRPIGAIFQICMTTVRSVFGEMDLDTSLASRELVNNKLRSVLDEATDKWGIKVVRVEIQEIKPPADLVDEMKKQMIAERNRRVVVAAAEGEKRAKVLEAEGVKDAEILRATADSEAAVLRATAERKRRILEAEGEARVHPHGARGNSAWPGGDPVGAGRSGRHRCRTDTADAEVPGDDRQGTGIGAKHEALPSYEPRWSVWRN